MLCGENESVLVRLHSSCCRFGDRRGLRFGIEQWARSQAEHGIQLLVGTRHPPLTSTLLFRIEPLTSTPLLNFPQQRSQAPQNASLHAQHPNVFVKVQRVYEPHGGDVQSHIELAAKFGL